MKKKMFVLLLALALLLTGCGAGSVTLDLSGVKTDPERLVAGSFSDVDVSLGDVGLFYPLDNTLRYYDLEKREEYILCPRANCMHNSSDCIAYFASNLVGESAKGVAQIDQYIYCFYFGISLEDYANNSPKAVQLLRIDPNKGTREAVASFPCAMIVADGETDEQFYANGVSEISYCNGWAWCYLDMRQSYGLDEQLDYSQLTGINLETGEVVALNGYDDLYYNFMMITADNVYYRTIRETPQLTEAEWYDRFGDEPGTIDGNSFDSWFDYWCWHVNHTTKEYCYYAYNIASGETTLLTRCGTVLVSEIGRGEWQSPPWYLEGVYDGRVLLKELVPDEAGAYAYYSHTAFSLLDPVTGEMERVEALDNTYSYSVYTMGNNILSDGSYYYCKRTSADTIDVWLYNFSTGENRFLFTDNANWTFMIYGEYNAGYFGKHREHQYLEGYYWISKEDFLAGNLDAMVHYDAGGSEPLWN